MTTPEDCPMLGLRDGDVIANGIEVGLRRVIEDKALMRQFGRDLYEELATHAINGSSMWFGRRLFIWFVTAIVLAGLAFLVRSGALK